jgi:hypothetical protein
VAARYDRKIARAYLVLHYPSLGQGIDQNGAKLDNVYLAQRILDKLEAASGVAIGDIPSELAPGQDPNQTAWRLEVQGSAGGQQQGFVDRLRYLDSLKVRGMLLPERAILEGQHGTLAESESQGDMALLQAEANSRWRETGLNMAACPARVCARSETLACAVLRQSRGDPDARRRRVPGRLPATGCAAFSALQDCAGQGEQSHAVASAIGREDLRGLSGCGSCRGV